MSKQTKRNVRTIYKTEISKVIVQGYKSINEKKELDVSSLTILAGPNSSGKSSFIQPILLMKQTLEEGFDPGPLLLNGPLVKINSIDPLLFMDNKGNRKDRFTIGFEINGLDKCEITFKKTESGLYIENAYYEIVTFDENAKKTITKLNLNKNTPKDNLKKLLPNYISDLFQHVQEENVFIKIRRNRCYLGIHVGFNEMAPSIFSFPDEQFHMALRNLIYLPGLRGNPERYYPASAIDSNFDQNILPGSFDKYVASLITQWQMKDQKRLRRLEGYLLKLGLTNHVRTKKINDTEVSINVGRDLNIENQEMLVNIADVGLGVSQTLPVLVALVFAKAGQVVYIEQPEIHLHPRAQYYFAEILSEVINSGVKVVIETHSSLIIKGIQTIVAKKMINPDQVALHWLKKNKLSGETELNSTKLDSNGAFGDWPIDFDDVEITAEMNYLDAMEEF